MDLRPVRLGSWVLYIMRVWEGVLYGLVVRITLSITLLAMTDRLGCIYVLLVPGIN
jgi:hypothetical protein